MNFFLYVDTNSHTVKFDQNIFGWAWSKMDVTSLVTDRENRFFKY